MPLAPFTADHVATATVHIVDREAVVRRSVAALMRASGLAAHAYASLADFLDSASEAADGCIVVDLATATEDAPALILRLKQKGLRHPVIVAALNADIPMAVEAMRAGAWDVVLKPLDGMALLISVRAALYAAARVATPEAAAGGFHDLFMALSPREQLVLRGVVAGQANKLIAYELGISPRTVEAHRAHMMIKTGATSVSALVRMAMLAGL